MAICGEFIEVEHLLFFLGETLESIPNNTLDYRKLKSESAKMLAYVTNRSISQLVTRQIILVSKVTDLEKVV